MPGITDPRISPRPSDIKQTLRYNRPTLGSIWFLVLGYVSPSKA